MRQFILGLLLGSMVVGATALAQEGYLQIAPDGSMTTILPMGNGGYTTFSSRDGIGNILPLGPAPMPSLRPPC